MDPATLFKANVYLTILFMSLDKNDENDAFYIKCLLALGATAGTFGYLFQGPPRPCVPPKPPTVTPPTDPPLIKQPPGSTITQPPPVTPPPVTPPPVTPPPVTPPPVTPPVPKPSDYSVALVDPEPYHAGAVLFKRCYKNTLGQVHQALVSKAFERIPVKDIVAPNKTIRISLGKFTVNSFVDTNGIYFNLTYLENLYTKHAGRDNNIEFIKQNLLNELLNAYIDFLRLRTGNKQVVVRDTLTPNVTGITVTGRTREVVDNRDIHGFAAKNLPFRFEHLNLNDPNYVNSTHYRNYVRLMQPLGASENDYYVIVARELTNLVNPGDIKTALQDKTRRITVKISPMSGASAFVRTFGDGRKEMEWNQSMLAGNISTQLFIDILTHETAHCVDFIFPRSGPVAPSYVGEGFASWATNKIKGLPWARWPRPRDSDWRKPYDTFAAFLEYVDRNSPGFVTRFYHVRTNNGYTEELIRTLSGKTGDEWWRQYLSDPERKV